MRSGFPIRHTGPIIEGFPIESERQLRGGCRILIVVASVLCGGRGLLAAERPPDVFLPSFWDSQRVLEKPDLDPATTIRFVTGDDYAPFDFTLADGTLTGFNVDLARALCDELKVSCTIQARAWETIVPAVTGREADAAIASLSITEEARKTVAFTRAYYRTPARFLTRSDATLGDPTPEALAGKKVGVQSGTAHEAYLRTFFPGATIVPFSSAASARAALKNGTIDALFDDGIAAALWLNGDAAGGCCVFRGGPFTESRFFGQGAGIAVRKDDQRLRRALDYALAQVAAKGVYADLYLKYFPIGFY
ncbi:transporter substrate-binding domain-containing protein [Lichenifustis flavocetrariae]|uniref:Transporter substrate-binding domain-containing protein n=1 Tax=Lichenifustis flavocetrariae TaxID=2949735 RepID=A0AA41Z2C9_9HYPH|nr:transporter substrate-binding domain-containing protein [Lichenifustis flavocetrariae]MCW6508007.1 transporter substrate-binding domain-containing protein [Lichenifustis flavocetrariae]